MSTKSRQIPRPATPAPDLTNRSVGSLSGHSAIERYRRASDERAAETSTLARHLHTLGDLDVWVGRRICVMRDIAPAPPVTDAERDAEAGMDNTELHKQQPR